MIAEVLEDNDSRIISEQRTFRLNTNMALYDQAVLD